MKELAYLYSRSDVRFCCYLTQNRNEFQEFWKYWLTIIHAPQVECVHMRMIHGWKRDRSIEKRGENTGDFVMRMYSACSDGTQTYYISEIPTIARMQPVAYWGYRLSTVSWLAGQYRNVRRRCHVVIYQRLERQGVSKTLQGISMAQSSLLPNNSPRVTENFSRFTQWLGRVLNYNLKSVFPIYCTYLGLYRVSPSATASNTLQLTNSQVPWDDTNQSPRDRLGRSNPIALAIGRAGPGSRHVGRARCTDWWESQQ